MTILAIDTSGEQCSVCLYDETNERALITLEPVIGRGHAEKLIGLIEECFTKSGCVLSDISKIAVAIGPGSFTGLRVGIATARGLALALDTCSLVGISTLHATAADVIALKTSVDNSYYTGLFIALDARRGEVYGQIFCWSGKPESTPRVYTLEDAEQTIKSQNLACAGSGIPLLNIGRERIITASEILPSIETVSRLGAQTQATDTLPKPLYLRAPDAKPQVGFAVSRV